MGIKEIQKRVHQIAVEKGFWDCEGHDPSDHDCSVCNGTGKHKNYAEVLALIHSEVSEALECLRDGSSLEFSDKFYSLSARVANEKWDKPMCGDYPPYCGECISCEIQSIHDEHGINGSNLAEELSDIVIRAMDFAESQGIDLSKSIPWKMTFNETGKDGKKFWLA